MDRGREEARLLRPRRLIAKGNEVTTSEWNEGDAPMSKPGTQVGHSLAAPDQKPAVYVRATFEFHENDMAAHLEAAAAALGRLTSKARELSASVARIHRALTLDLSEVMPDDGGPPVLMHCFSIAFVPSENQNQ
jgi:hypothetical protein